MTATPDPHPTPDVSEPLADKTDDRVDPQITSEIIPFLGEMLSAATGTWPENDQGHVNKMFQQWLGMLEDEWREKGQTMVEIMARLDIADEVIKARIASPAYQALLKHSFRNWSPINSEQKRQKLRNILVNAAVTDIVTDDVVRLFLGWVAVYSDFHFEVIENISRNAPTSRGQVWKNLNRPDVPEDSAEGDLFKLLIRDLSTGGVIHQERSSIRHKQKMSTLRDPRRVSAFDEKDHYGLTRLGAQFVHYAMNDLVLQIEIQGIEEGEWGRN